MTLQEFHWLLFALLVICAGQWLRHRWRQHGPANSATEASAPRAQSLAAAMLQHGDNFLLLRLLAASAVIYGHSYALSGIPGAADHIARQGWGYGLYSGSIAVDIFFALSGFLVAGSWQRRPHLAEFLRARALRILPGYLACLVGSACVLGAIYTTLPLNEYFSDPHTFAYVTTNLQFHTTMQWDLPGVFVGNPYPNVVNGSLWTLPGEVRVYALLALFGVLGLLEHRHRFVLAAVALLALGIATPEKLPVLVMADFARLAGWFALGVVFHLYREVVPLKAWIALLLFATAVALHGTGLFPYAFALAVTYACLWFAYRPRRLLGFNRLGDYSYGVYLWGFPVQQAVIHHLVTPTPLKILALSLPIALAIAVVSWHLVEKPALRWKRSRVHSQPPTFLDERGALPDRAR